MPAIALARAYLGRVPAPVLAVLFVLFTAVIVVASVLASAHGVAVHHLGMLYDGVKNKMLYD